MRRLAPMFLTTSILAFAGSALAVDSSPTRGNPVMGGQSKDATTALSNDDSRKLSKANEQPMSGNSNAAVAANTSADVSTTTPAKPKAKKAKKKVAKNDNVSGNPPTTSTNPAAAKSTDGRSAGS